MKDVASRDPLDRLAAGAAAQKTASAELDQQVTTALLAARGRRARRDRLRLWAMAACVPVMLGTFAWLAREEPAPAPTAASAPATPGTLELPTGDRITTRSQSDLAVARLDANDRRITLTSGEALFDVAPLGADGHFEVTTPHLHASVRGTVFAIEVGAHRSRVHVFEGVVAVESGNRREELHAGASFDSSGSAPWTPSLAREGRAAASRRDVAPVATVNVPAPEMPAPVHVPAPTSTGALQAWLESGQLDRALDACARQPQAREGEWRMSCGDALRAGGRTREAAGEYDAAAASLSPSRATQAGFLAAELRLSLDDPRGAIASLAAARSAEAGSPLEERATALLARAQIAAGDRDTARETARRYLLRFPAGAARSWMGRVAELEAPGPR